MQQSLDQRVSITYQPVLDVARGVAAGFQLVLSTRSRSARGDVVESDEQLPALVTAVGIRRALNDIPTLPKNTFVAIPLHTGVAASEPVRAVLLDHRGDQGAAALSGIILDIVGFDSTQPPGRLEDVIAEYRGRGALIAVGGHGTAQPELTSIVRLKPAIIRLGRDWVRGIDRLEAKRSAIEITGQLAGQLDAWVLAEGVSTSAELRALAGLGVPLAEGPFIGGPQPHWPDIELSARTSLPRSVASSDGVLRGLLQQTYTTTNAVAAAAVLPETSGFDCLVVLDAHQRPVSMLEQDVAGDWATQDVLTVNVDTSLADAVSRAMARPRLTRFTPLACTDNAGRFVGILRIERLMSHLSVPTEVGA